LAGLAPTGVFGQAPVGTRSTLRHDAGATDVRMLPNSRDGAVRQVQETAGDPTVTPPPVPPDPGITPGVDPNETDLSIPRAERNDEPTEAEAAEEAAEDTNEATPLMRILGIEDSPIKIYGWIQNSYTGNTNGQNIHTNPYNFGVNPNFLANRWMGNQYYLILEKTLEQNDEVNFGFRIDNLFGNDWQFNHMQGLNNGSFTNNHFAGYDPAQMYVEAHLPILTEGGLDIKGGRFYTIAGYEVVPAIGRPLLSVPYMFNYGQPFTHFGALTTLHLTDRINLYNGAINGWDRWINTNYKWGYIGGFSWSSEDQKTSLAFTTVWGPNQYPSQLPANQDIYLPGYINVPSVAGLKNPGYTSNDRVLFTTVLTHKWSDKLTQVIETDQGNEQNIPGLGAPIVNGVPINGRAKSAQWYSFGNWFLYSFNEKLTGVWRSEVFWDEQGARTGTLQGDRYYEQTLGLIYKPKSWLWVRPEARYDWAQYHTPYANGTKGSQVTLAFDVIVLF
jgi:hypothetical protein